MYPNENTDVSDDLSQGLTFEQISQAIDVVQGKKTGEADEIAAGETLCIMPSDFVDTICRQAEHEAMVKRLIAGYVDFTVKIKPASALIANFDINKYV
jgi:hypothetical protein